MPEHSKRGSKILSLAPPPQSLRFQASYLTSLNTSCLTCNWNGNIWLTVSYPWVFRKLHYSLSFSMSPSALLSVLKRGGLAFPKLTPGLFEFWFTLSPSVTLPAAISHPGSNSVSSCVHLICISAHRHCHGILNSASVQPNLLFLPWILPLTLE